MNDWQWLAVFAIGTALIVGPLIGGLRDVVDDFRREHED